MSAACAWRYWAVAAASSAVTVLLAGGEVLPPLALLEPPFGTVTLVDRTFDRASVKELSMST